MKKRRFALAVVGIGVISAGTVLADTVHTSDGSKFVGDIIRWSDDKLAIHTEVAGMLEIDASKIIAVATDTPLTVEFASGDRLVGTMEVSADLKTTIMHTAIGNVSVPSEKITSVWPVGAESPQIAALKKQVERTIEAAKPKWTATLEAGGSATEGNTDTMKARGRFDLRRQTPDDLLHFYLAARYSEQNDQRDTNEYRGGVDYQSSLTERTYWYTRMDMEFDEFEDLDLRTTAAAGGGYYWLKKPDHELQTRLGLGYRHESYNNQRTEDGAVIDVGVDYRLDIAHWASFTHSTKYSPDFEDFDDYRLAFDTALVFPLKDDRWKLKLGMRNEYNSRPQRGFDRLDSTYYTSVVLELK